MLFSFFKNGNENGLNDNDGASMDDEDLDPGKTSNNVLSVRDTKDAVKEIEIENKIF